jgi:L-threonylcarbamoyladenylate synthase
MALVRYARSTRHIIELRNQLRKYIVVAAPTETAYGLLADAVSSVAVVRVVKLKGRERGKPIALIAPSLAMVRRYFRLSKAEQRLAKKFWPGPLTLVLKPKKRFPRAVTGAGGYVGVRVPKDAWLRKLVTAFGKPLTATSANRSGKPALYSGSAVQKELGARGLRHLVDAGQLKRRPTSTVVRVRGSHLIVFREGAVPRAKLSRVLG